MKKIIAVMCALTQCLSLFACGAIDSNNITGEAEKAAEVMATSDSETISQINFYEANTKAKNSFTSKMKEVDSDLETATLNNLWDSCVSVSEDRFSIMMSNLDDSKKELSITIFLLMAFCAMEEFGVDKEDLEAGIGKGINDEITGENDVVSWSIGVRGLSYYLMVTRK
ncbi:MAG: hypothetical protein IJ746_03355 [Ruminococcus sp.]|nr:hypothetical protein [Ruminococcus sp.]